MTKIGKTHNTKSGATGPLNRYRWECQKVQTLWKFILWKFLIKLNIHFPYGSVVPLLHIYWTEIKTFVHMKTHMQLFITVSSIIAPNWKQMSINSWMQKKILYLYNGILLHDKNEQTVDTCHRAGESQKQNTVKEVSRRGWRWDESTSATVQWRVSINRWEGCAGKEAGRHSHSCDHG